MIRLGFHDGHGAGAVLAVDGRVALAVSEERLTRRKRERGFPRRSIEWILGEAGLAPDDVEQVACASRWGRATPRWLDARYRAGFQVGGPSGWPARLVATLENQVAGAPWVRDLEGRASRAVLRHRLAELGLGGAPLDVLDHHTAHALGAAYAAGFGVRASGADRELVLTLDGYGDGLAGSASVVSSDGGGGATLERVASLPWKRSLGVVYGVVAELLGFAEGDEGQVTALAASGDPERHRALFAELVPIAREERAGALPFAVDGTLLFGALRDRIRGAPAEDVARGLQDRVEEAVVAFAAHALGLVRSRGAPATRLACAGGLFANVRLGPRLAALPDVAEVVVCPAMTDDGLALGAALGANALAGPGHEARLRDVFWGPDITPQSADTALSDARCTTGPHDATAALAAAARLLDEGAVIGLATGRLEHGPRALGHRSILFDARRTELTARVSRILRRPPHMPFAPATLASDAERSYLGIGPLASTARFMTVAVETTAWFRATAPAAVHVDGSARAQLVTGDGVPCLAALLASFQERTGVGTLINTSFNLHGEPIVATAADAVATFRAAELDALLIAGRLVRR